MNPYIYIAIGVVILLVIINVVTFVLNRKTPLPKGCEDMKINEENCSGCTNSMCDLKQKIDLKKIEDEIKEDKEK